MGDFRLRLNGPAPGSTAQIVLDCDSEADALRVASQVVSPHGHALFAGERFLGRFEPRWGEHLDEADVVEAEFDGELTP